MIESMTNPTQLKTLEQLKATLETTVKIETSSNNEDAKKFSSLRAELIQNADKLPELNENALKAATSEQTVSVASLKMEYFRLSLDELGAELQKVLTSKINNQQLRVDALRGLIKENTKTLELVGGSSKNVGESNPTAGFFSKFLNNARSKFVNSNK